MSTAAARNAVLDGKNLVRLISTRTEMEAGIIIGALEEHEIPAAMSGTFTANFRTEAPGNVDVLIAEHDLSRAAEVLNTLHAEQGTIDWSQVDVGDPEEDEATASVPSWMGLKFWRRIAIVCITIYFIYLGIVISGVFVDYASHGSTERVNHLFTPKK